METDTTHPRRGDDDVTGAAVPPGAQACGPAARAAGGPAEGGEAPCYTALVCPGCGAVMGDHHPTAPCGP